MEARIDNQKSVILVYPWGNPLHASSGIEKRSSVLLSILMKFGAAVDIIAPVPIPSRNFHTVKFLSYRGHGGLLLDLNPSYYLNLMKLIVGKRGSVSIVLTGPLGIMGAFFSKLLFKRQKRVLIIYDAHNVEKERLLQKSISRSKLSAPFFVTKFIYLASEFLATKLSDVIWSVSWEDKKKFVEFYGVPPEKIMVVPSDLGTSPSETDKLSASSKLRRELGRPVCVFHGTYSYLPNREAVDIIIKKIAPEVPEAYFFIAGKGVPRNMENIPENVRLVGFVENLEEFLASCDIAVVPLKRGAGTKLKMYDYMRAGLAIVTTRKGAEGLGLVEGRHAIVVCEVNTEFVSKLKYLVNTPKIIKKLGYNARLLRNQFNPSFKIESIFKKVRE